MIYAWTQAFNTTPEYILHGISYKNLILYSSAAPSYGDTKDGGDEWDDSIDANNPDNFNNNEEEEEFI